MFLFFPLQCEINTFSYEFVLSIVKATNWKVDYFLRIFDMCNLLLAVLNTFFPFLSPIVVDRYMLSRAGVPRHSIIKKFAGEDISDVNHFLSVLSKLSRGIRVPLEFITYTDRHRNKV